MKDGNAVKKSKASKDREVVVVLPDIRSSHNIGSIFRTCDAAGVSRIVIAGYSPCPVDKFGRIQKEIAKTALGAEKDIPWTYSRHPKAALKKLRKDGFQIVGVELDSKAVPYREVKIKDKVAFVFGSEVEGLSRGTLDLCDIVAAIPMQGNKESLNVSVSAGIALFGMLGL